MKKYKCDLCDADMQAVELLIVLPEEFDKNTGLRLTITKCEPCDYFEIESFDFVDTEILNKEANQTAN